MAVSRLILRLCWSYVLLVQLAVAQIIKKGAITHFPDIIGNYTMLTFDDGPHEIITPLLLDVLKAKGVLATFYVVGMKAALHPHIIQRMVAEGHDVANHGYIYVVFLSFWYSLTHTLHVL